MIGGFVLPAVTNKCQELPRSFWSAAWCPIQKPVTSPSVNRGCHGMEYL